MKKILFVTTRYPQIKSYSGDTLRAYNIIKNLRKKNIVDVVCINEKNKDKIIDKQKNGKIYFCKKINILSKIFYSMLSMVNLKPLQLGFFYSKEIKEFLLNNHKNYDSIIFHLIRSAQYLPAEFTGKKILEMTDIMSNNYDQTKKNLNILNPYYYLYLFESFLVKKYERYCLKIFNQIVIVSKADIARDLKKTKKKIIIIGNGVEINKKKFKFNKNNFKIIFIGNINYLPNKYACYDFVKKILPRINIIDPKIEFHIIGKISILDRVKLGFFKKVKVVGPVDNLNVHINSAICGISNLKIATGMQNKTLTYMSYGLPAICSHRSSRGITILKNYQDFISYNDEKKFISQILELKKNKVLANRLSNNSYQKIKKLSWNIALLRYKEII